MDRHSRLSKSLVDRLPELAVKALSGGACFVHQLTGSKQWRFGKLHKVDGVDVLTVEGAGEASQLGDLLIVVAMGDDSDALVVRDDRHMTCMYWYHDDRSFEKLKISLGQWLDEARRIDVGGLDDRNIQITPPALLVGQWQPQQVLTPGMKGHLKTVPSIELLNDGRWIEYWRWPSKTTRRTASLDWRWRKSGSIFFNVSTKRTRSIAIISISSQKTS